MKGKSVFYWFGISWLFLSGLQAAGPMNEATARVAAKIYWVGNQAAAAQEWGRAFSAFEIARLLKPEWTFLPQRKTEEKKQTAARKKGVPNKTKEMIEEAKRVLEQGDKAEAIFVLKELVQAEPKEERAQILLTRLEAETKGAKENGGYSETIRQSFEKAERLFEEGRKTRRYPPLREALALFQEGDLKPAFYAELQALAEKLSEELRQKIAPTLQCWEKETERSGTDLKSIGRQLRKIEKEYPPLEEITQLLQKIYAKLEARAKPIFLRAQTVLELEGCPAAVDAFKKAKEIAGFPEVSFWQEANKNIEACLKAQTYHQVPGT